MTEDDHIDDNETKKDSGVESGEVSDSGKFSIRQPKVIWNQFFFILRF